MTVGGFFIEIKMYTMKQNIKLIFHILDRVLMDKEVSHTLAVGIVSERDPGTNTLRNHELE